MNYYNASGQMDLSDRIAIVDGCLRSLFAIFLNDSPMHIPVSIAIRSDRSICPLAL